MYGSSRDKCNIERNSSESRVDGSRVLSVLFESQRRRRRRQVTGWPRKVVYLSTSGLPTARTVLEGGTESRERGVCGEYNIEKTAPPLNISYPCHRSSLRPRSFVITRARARGYLCTCYIPFLYSTRLARARALTYICFFFLLSSRACARLYAIFITASFTRFRRNSFTTALACARIIYTICRCSPDNNNGSIGSVLCQKYIYEHSSRGKKKNNNTVTVAGAWRASERMILKIPYLYAQVAQSPNKAQQAGFPKSHYYVQQHSSRSVGAPLHPCRARALR